MKSDKSKNQRRQNVSKKIETPKSTSILSPISDKRYIASKTPKDTEYFSKDLLENTRKYLEMSNGNNNYLITPITTINDYSDKFSSPTLHEDYNISQKYNDIYDYSDYTPNYIREGLDNDNGNEKLHRVKDEYIEYLQRQLEENNKNVIRLESKLNDLQKRFKNLIDDNRLLNDTLNERNSKLNEFIQENENLRLQMNNYIDNEAKYRLQIQYCEKQIGLYETNIKDYNNIIKDLRNSNEKLTTNLSQKFDNKNNKNNGSNNNFSTNNSNNFNNYNYFNVRNIQADNDGELQFLKNQNMIYINNIKSKDYTIEYIQKKNEKLISENKIYRTQIEQYIQQIGNLYTILKQKNKIISIFKQKGGVIDSSIESEFEKLEELNMNFMNNTFNNNKELLLNYVKDDMPNTSYNNENMDKKIRFNSNIDKLMTDNEENRKKIEMLNGKIKSLSQVDDNFSEYTKTNNNNLVKVVNSSKKESVQENGLRKTDTNNLDSNKDVQYNPRPRKNVFKNKKEEEKFKSKEDNMKVIFGSKEEKNNKIIEDKKKEQNTKPEEEEKNNSSDKSNKKKKHIQFSGLLEEKEKEKEEIKETVKEMGRKKNLSHVPKVKKKFKISDLLDITEINTSSPVITQNLSFSLDDTELIKSLITNNSTNSIYLFGIDREDDLHIFNLIEKKFSKKKILEIEDISDTFNKDYQYDGTILYNTFTGLFILTGKKLDILYYYNPKYDTMNKICKFNYSHDNGSLLLDKEFNRIFAFGGKETTKCEYYSFSDKNIYDVPDLTTDRANASFIICNYKIYGFFGFSYKNNKYCGNIEYIDIKKLDKWEVVKDIKVLDEKLNFEIESVSTINYKENKDKILIYSGIQGDNEDYVTDYYYLYDTKENSMELVEKWENKIMKYTGSRWRNSNLTKKDPAGFHFAKNSNFLKLPKEANIEGYEDDLYLLMDYKNNVHFIDQDEKTIDIFKSDAL